MTISILLCPDGESHDGAPWGWTDNEPGAAVHGHEASATLALAAALAAKDIAADLEELMGAAVTVTSGEIVVAVPSTLYALVDRDGGEHFEDRRMVDRSAAIAEAKRRGWNVYRHEAGDDDGVCILHAVEPGLDPMPWAEASYEIVTDAVFNYDTGRYDIVPFAAS